MSLESERWSVTYTKQINKKRAVYQDGFLELQSTRRKVLLYDESDNLVDSRFTKKEDVIRSGETLKFVSHIVDVGEKCGGQEPKPDSVCQEKEKKVVRKFGTLHRQESNNNSNSLDRKPTLGKKNVPVINLSPSQKIIRDFKKSEVKKYISSPKCNNSSTTNSKASETKNNDSSPSFLDITKSTTTEWQVMYTTQITQKAKKFHDGVLQLEVRGISQRGQISLLAEDGTVLSHRHLKLSEDVKTGITLILANYMVEVGECHDDASSLKDSKVKTTSVDDASLSRRVRKFIPLFNAKITTSPVKITKVDGSSSQNNDTKSRCTTPALEPTCSVPHRTGVIHLECQGNAETKTSPTKLTKLDVPKNNDTQSRCTNPATEPKRSVPHRTGVIHLECQGKAETKTSPMKLTKLDGSKNNNTKSRCTSPATEPKRSAHDILSFLRKPTVPGDIKPMVKEPFQLHVSDIQSDIKSQGYAKHLYRSDVDEYEERTSDPHCSMNTTKPEALEIFNPEKNAVHEIEDDSQDNSSSFYLRSGAANPNKSVNDAICSNHFKLNLSSSASKDHNLVTPALDPADQVPIASTLPDISHIKVKIEDTSKIHSAPAIKSLAAASVTIDLTSHNSAKRHKDNGSSSGCEKTAASNGGVALSDWTCHDISGVKENTLKVSFNSMEADELPSFDLGF